MPNFEQDFIKSKGAPIKYKEWEIVNVDRISVQKKFSAVLRLISTNSEWRQAIRVKVRNGKLFGNSQETKSFIVWADDLKEHNSILHFEGVTKDLQFFVHNAWEQFDHRNTPFLNYWMGNAAMILEVDGNTRRYRCNDGLSDDNFDDIIFEITIDD